MGRKKTEWDESALFNNRTYGHYLMRFTELAISMFEWVNLPESMDERFLELTLFKRGSALVFKDEVMGLLGLKGIFTGGFDVYNVPKMRQGVASNGYHSGMLDASNSVIVWNNYLRQNSYPMVQLMAKRIWNLDRIIDINSNSQKTPYIVKASEKQRLTAKNLYMQVDGNEPVIFADDTLANDVLQVLRTEAPYVADKLYQLKTQYWNETLTYLGISNLNVQKKERFVTDEVTRNMGAVIASRYSRLEARRKAAEQINKMFGTDIDVQYREDYREVDDEYMIPGDSDGDKAPTQLATDLRTRGGKIDT